MLTGTTIGAARMLHTTQPSASRLLAQVASATELKLFELERGRLRPTPEAHRLFETIQRHFLGLEKIEQTVAVLRQSGTGILRIACTPTLGLGVLPRVIGDFLQTCPDVHINLQTISTHEIREGILHGMYDLGLTTNRVQSADLPMEVVHETEAVCVMARTHRLARRASVGVRDLAGQPLLALDADDELTSEWLHRLRDAGLPTTPVVETTYSATICALAESEVGLGIVNPYIASLFESRLCVVPLRPRLSVRTYIAYPQSIARSALTERFVERLLSRLAGDAVGRRRRGAQ